MLLSVVVVGLLYAIWSSVFSLAKIALQYTSPVFLTGFRMTVASILILGYLACAKRRELRFTRQQIVACAILGFFSIYLTNILEFWGLQYLTAAKACFIYSLSPFFASIFSYIHFKERMNVRKWLGLCIGLSGVFLIIMQQNDGETLHQAVGLLSWPSLALVGATLSAVYGWVFLRLLMKKTDLSPLSASGTSMLVGGLLALMHSLFSDTWNPLPIQAGELGPFMKMTFLIIAISNILCYNLYAFMLKRFTATFLSFIGLLSPIFASLHGWLFLHEPLSWTIFLSTAILLAGLWILYAEELKQGYITRSTKLKEA